MKSAAHNFPHKQQRPRGSFEPRGRFRLSKKSGTVKIRQQIREFYGIRRLDLAFRVFDRAYRFCHCEEGAIFAPDAAIFNEAICHPGTKYG